MPRGVSSLVLFFVAVAGCLGIIYVLNASAVNDTVGRARERFTEAAAEIILVYSDRCPHCVRFKPVLDEYVSRCRSRGKAVKVTKLESSTSDVSHLSVTAFPTTIIVAGGREQARKVGALPYADFAKFADSHIM